MSIGEEIAARGALEPAQVALVIFRALFERGPQRMSEANRFIAVGTITGGLVEWRKQILAGQENEAEKWKKLYKDAKAELDDVRLKLAVLQKEQ